MSEKERIIADYVGGMIATEVAAKYGRSANGLRVCLSRWGVKLSSEEKGRRIHEGHCVNKSLC